MPSAKPMTSEDISKTRKILELYKNKYGTLIDSKGYARTFFSLFKPYNLFVGIDRTTIHYVLSFNNAVPGMSHFSNSDLREFGIVLADQVIKACQRDLGFRDYAYFFLSVSLLDNSPEELDKVLDEIVKQNFERELKYIVMQTRALYIPLDFVKGYISEVSEDDFTQDILVPLLNFYCLFRIVHYIENFFS